MQLREASEQRKELERQHAEALALLREKTNEICSLSRCPDGERKKPGESIEALQSKIRELEKKTELQNVRHEELMLELAVIKRSQQSARASSQHSSLGQSPPDSPLCSTPDSALSRGESTTALSTPVVIPSLDAILEKQHQHYLPSISGSYPRGGSTAFFPSKCLHQDSLLYLHEPSTKLKSVSSPSPSLVATGVSHSLPRTHKFNSSPSRYGRKRLRRSTSVTDVNQVTTGAHYSKAKHTHWPQRSLHFDDSITSSHEIDRIIAKIQQDNKILAKLDKNSVSGSWPPRFSTKVPHEKSSHRRRTLPKKPATTKCQIPQIKIENDDDERGNVRDMYNLYDQTSTPHQPQTSSTPSVQAPSIANFGPVQPYQQIATVVPANFLPVLQTGTIFSSQGPTPLQPSGFNQPQTQIHHNFPSLGTNTPNLIGQPQPIQLPTLITSAQLDNTRGVLTPQQILSSSNVVTNKQHQLLPASTGNKGADMLEVPTKGCCAVFIARYSYDPFQQSPNENPEAELQLNSGDYVLVWTNIDEDGFLEGELLDGRKGLVPSNYVERLIGEDLIEFHQQVCLGLKPSEDRLNTMRDADYRDVGDESQWLMMVKNKGRIKRTLPKVVVKGDDVLANKEDLVSRKQEEYSYLELEDMLEDDMDPEKRVPPPSQLTLEKQLNKSVLVSWMHPDCPPGTIDSYQVYVNGLLRCTVKAHERTRALLEGVDCNRPNRISVRSVTPTRRSSRDAACTMVVGKDAPLSPACVRASSVTSTSAVISWLPSNSSYQHVVCVNNVEVRTVKPGVYRHTITGLTPNTTYRVTVRSKNIKAPHFDEKNSKQMEKLSAHTEFKTLPKGLPDPPVDVQVEAGPQDNTILVTWHPVTAGTSNGALVTGYAVFADGKKVLEIDSPSGDHALLDLNRFQGIIPKQVTVRTKSRDTLSSDSIPISIPAQVLKGKKGGKVDMPPQNSLPVRTRHPTMLESEEGYDRDYIPGYRMIPAIEITKEPERYNKPISLKERLFGVKNINPNPPTNPNPNPGATAAGRFRPVAPTERGSRAYPVPQQQPHPPPVGHHPPPNPGMARHRPGPPVHDDYYGKERGLPKPMDRGPIPRPRVFVALFDYDPQSMSPNPDGCEEELPFREGELIKIFGDKDVDGFYWGESRNRKGYVPCNMVSELPSDDERVQEFLAERDPMHDGGRERRPMGRDRWGDIYANTPVKKMVALYDYDPQELSPNVDSEMEMSFRTGDIIYVYGDMDEDGFFLGELNQMRGLVPSNFLTEAPPEYDQSGRGGRRPAGPYLGPSDGRRVPGPGARGPPLPPREGAAGHAPPVMHDRDGRGARKDASYPLDHSESRFPQEGPAGWRGGRGAGRGHPPGSTTSPGQNQGAPNSTDAATKRNSRGGVPQVLPEFSPTNDQFTSEPTEPLSRSSIGQNKVLPTTSGASSSATSANPVTSKLPGVFSETPNLMQKFSELTHSAIGGEAEGDSILSKGKELIFKKFGLGN